MLKDSIAVFGFGKTGKAVLNFLLESEIYSQIYLYSDRELDVNNLEIKIYLAKNVKIYFGESGFEKIASLIKTVVLSPGFNGREKRFDDLRDKGIKVISEIEFAYSFIDKEKTEIIALTGTNGKSTTVSLIYHFLKESGYNTVLAGNIGNPFISEIERIRNMIGKSYVVLELSSFQLEDIYEFKPNISLILNITPDHLDRYTSMKDYIDAKLNLVMNCDMRDHIVFNADDYTLKSIDFEDISKHSFSLNNKQTDIYLNGKELIYNFKLSEIVLSGSVSIKNNPLRGIHNLENILAAVLTVLIIGLKSEEIESALGSFKGLEHRMELAGSLNGVEFINDSKATNVDSTIKSSKSFNNDMVIILGGKDKGGSFTGLDVVLAEKAKGILLIGAAKEKIYNDLENCKGKMNFVDNFDEAIVAGYDILKKKGGVLLLAPACASFDMFDNFEDRGKKFKISVVGFIEKMRGKKNG